VQSANDLWGIGHTMRPRHLVLPALLPALALAVWASPSGAVNAPQSVVVTADPANFTPHVLDGKVDAFVQVGNKMIAGGLFTKVQQQGSATVLSRSNIFAFDATTGVVDGAFAPSVDGEVETLATDGTSVFAGGAFNYVNGVKSKSLTKLNPASGARLTQFKAQTNGRVHELVLRNGRLYIGGNFKTVKSVGRIALAALDPVTGALGGDVNFAFAGARGGGAIQVAKLDVTPDGSRLVAIGNWTTVNGLELDQIAMFNLTANPAVLANWQTLRFQQQCASVFDTYMRDVDFSPDGAYFVVGTTGAYRAGSLCDTASRWETGATGSGLQPTWVDYTGGDTIWSVAATGTAVYIGGHERWANNSFAGDKAGPGAVGREGIGALDPLNGMPLSWNPGRDRGVGVFGLYATPAGLWVGSDTDRIGRYEHHAKVAFFPVAGGTAMPQTRVGALPGDLHSAGTDGSLVRRTFDGATLGAASPVATGVDWSHARGAFMISGRLYSGWDDNNLYVRSFDGATAGTATALDTHGLNTYNFPVSNLSGAFYDPSSGRLYYTVAGDARLYSRYFEFESNLVGADVVTASGNGDGFNWSAVRGLTMANGRMYYATTSGNLYGIAFGGGRPTGSATLLSGPGLDGVNWQSRGLFVLAS
jgi:hypothetical protein